MLNFQVEAEVQSCTTVQECDATMMNQERMPGSFL
jgi:hypothetical protein